MIDLTDAEEEIARWREACELEVEAGKAAMEERDKEVIIPRKQELGFLKIIFSRLQLIPLLCFIVPTKCEESIGNGLAHVCLRLCLQ